jgi:RimJ/RimL family protein N-acetyltransferase
VTRLSSERLLLREWRDDDLEPLAGLCADPVVMEHFPGPMDRDQTAAMLTRMRAHFDRHPFGFWAAEERATGALLGFIGLAVPSFNAPFTPCVEIGWRLARSSWGKGLATEGAQVVLRHGFEVLHLPEIVSFTVPANVRSRRVMEKLGMRRDLAGDFQHPNLPQGHPLRAHVLYRLSRPG